MSNKDPQQQEKTNIDQIKLDIKSTGANAGAASKSQPVYFDMSTGAIGRFFLLDVFKLLFYFTKVVRQKNKLTLDDCPILKEQESSQFMTEQFNKQLEAFLASKTQKDFTKGDLLKIMYRVFGSRINFQLFITFIFFIAKIFNSVFVSLVIYSLQEGNMHNAYLYLLALVGLITFCNFGFHHINKVSYQTVSLFRVTFMVKIPIQSVK